MQSHIQRSLSRTEHAIERTIFLSRWLLVPFYIGLVVGLLVLLARFWVELKHLVATAFSEQGSATIFGVLSLIDLSLLANLVLIVIFSGYESFVSRIETDEKERPAWMGKIDFAGLKVKLMGSLAAISGIYLLEALLELSSETWMSLGWKLGIHLTFVVSGLLFALTERIEASAESSGSHH